MRASRTIFPILAAAAGLLGAIGVQSLSAQQPTFSRNVLQKADLSVPGREAVQITAEFGPGGTTGRHTHFGEEIGYVLEGSFLFTLEGRTPVILKAGDHFFVPAGAVHEATNTGKTNAKVVVTYFVEKGKPLVTPVK